MNVKLAAQTISSSVADAIEFLDVSMKLPGFQDTKGTVVFTRTIDRLFDILNSRNPFGKGYKQPLRLKSKVIWELMLKSTADYLLTLKTDTDTPQFLSTHRRKTFIIGFVTTIKSTIEMANQMLSSSVNPFKYLLTYKYSQDHIELLFSCIRSRGGWNNNPNSLQLKYALRKMLLRNAVTASMNGNCSVFTDSITSAIIPIFHTRKHSSPPPIDMSLEDEPNNSTQVRLMVEQLDESHTEFISNVLFYIAGFIVSKLVKKAITSCPACINSLVASCPSAKSDHDYCGVRYNEVAAASAFTLFVNKGGLTIPSKSVFKVVEYAERIFKVFVCKEGNKLNHEKNIQSRMVLEICHHFLVESRQALFEDHEQGMNEGVLEDHRMKLIKCIAVQYFTLRLFNYGKRYHETVVLNGQSSDRHKLTKLILFKNQ